MHQETPVLIQRRGPANCGLGTIMLNMPKALNALNLEMIQLILQQLDDWARDDSIAAVWIEGCGENFCAGGDVVALHRSASSYGEVRSSKFIADFFSCEYRLDYRIHSYPKPIVVWGTGFVFGGGLGILVGASHRIVTETTRMAMPEITIGLFPDVGGSWFLNRMPGRLGLFLGLSGAHFNGADAIYAGVADRLLPNTAKEQLLDQLAQLPFVNGSDSLQQNNALISRFLKTFALPATQLPASKLRQHFDTIQTITDYPTLEEVYCALTSYKDGDPWLQRAAKTLAAGSPLTARIVWEQLQRGKYLSLVEVFQMELALALNLCASGQVKEGVRALLIDKDRKPLWQPASLEEITTEKVEQYFAAAWPSTNPLADLEG